MKNHALSIWILIALVAGIVVGAVAPGFAVKMHPLATIFLRMVKMIIAPLLFATLVVGIAGHGDVKKVGRVGLKTILYFEIVTTIALFIGLGVANFTNPGLGSFKPISIPNIDEITQMSSMVHQHSFSAFFTSMFPTSIVQSMADGNLLQIVVFSIFFALAICTIGQKAKPVMDLLNSVCQIMFKFTEFVMLFAPIGIFGAISYTIGSNGLIVLKNYAKIIGSLYFALFIFVVLVLFIACKKIGRAHV